MKKNEKEKNQKKRKPLKVCAISDTHNRHNKVEIPECDVLVHTGDYSFTGQKSEVKNFYKWLNKQPAKYKISIQGNHEIGWEDDPDRMYEIAMKECPNGIHFYNDGIEIEGYNFWGSPVTPEFYDWAFMKSRGMECKKVWIRIPDDTDVLLTHGPPKFILDLCRNGYVGCEDLADEVLHRVKPKYHIFGHIHESYGQTNIKGINFINASICDGDYIPNNKPVIFELNDD